MSFESGHSTPLLLTRFFGRESEEGELADLLQQERLVTLVGAPGCGKTRLSQELAARLADRFPGGVRYVELASVTDPSLTTHAVAAALGVRDRPQASVEDALAEHLGAREGLLVVDNCEHLLGAVADLAERLLARCPGLRLLATSRMALGVPGERVRQVLPLDPQPAVELFGDRSRLAAGDLPLHQSRRQIEQICRRLDGVPLAIELAAAWTRVLTPAQILDHLDRVMALPGGRAPRGSPRQHTMEATVDWSYRLLEPAEQSLFEDLSVFAGGFDLAAAQAVASGDNVLRGLASLVEHSLVLSAPLSGPSRSSRPSGLSGSSGDVMRYRLLEPLRQFAASRLEKRGDQDAIRWRHAEHYLDVATRADAELRVREPRAVVARLELDEGNFRLALEHARDQSGELGLRLCTALARPWALRGRVSEGRAWLDEMLEIETSDRELRCRALAVASRLAWRQLDHGATRRFLDESLALARELGEPRRVARRLRSLAMIALTRNELDEAQQLCREAITIFRDQGDDYGLSLALAFRGVALQLAGEHDEARSHAFEALQVSRANGNLMGGIYALAALAFNAVATGERDAIAALEPYRDETVALLRALGGIPEDPGWMWVVITIAVAAGHDRLALRLAGAVEAKAGGDGVQLHDTFRRYMLPWLDRARARVGMAEAAQLATEGSALTADQLTEECIKVLEVVQPLPPSGGGGGGAGGGSGAVTGAGAGAGARVGGSDSASASPLSPREEEVAHLVARGLSNGEIAQELVISKRTVESHIDHIKRKLALTRRSQIVAWATDRPPETSPTR